MKINKIIQGLLVVSTIAGLSGCGQDNNSSTGEGGKSIKHNGIQYGTIKSPYTGKIWLDRNLGATTKCHSKLDYACYGDYYQWGRRTDGHEKVTIDVKGNIVSISATTHEEVERYRDKSGPEFVLVPDDGREGVETGSRYDWFGIDGAAEGSAARTAFWERTDGSSICPKGFRVALTSDYASELTQDDHDSAEVETLDDAFNSFLSLSPAGYRSAVTGKIMELGQKIAYWTATEWDGTPDIIVTNDGIFHVGYSASYPTGLPVRCLKD